MNRLLVGECYSMVSTRQPSEELEQVRRLREQQDREFQEAQERDRERVCMCKAFLLTYFQAAREEDERLTREREREESEMASAIASSQQEVGC